MGHESAGDQIQEPTPTLLCEHSLALGRSVGPAGPRIGQAKLRFSKSLMVEGRRLEPALRLCQLSRAVDARECPCPPTAPARPVTRGAQPLLGNVWLQDCP